MKMPSTLSKMILEKSTRKKHGPSHWKTPDIFFFISAGWWGKVKILPLQTFMVMAVWQRDISCVYPPLTAVVVCDLLLSKECNRCDTELVRAWASDFTLANLRDSGFEIQTSLSPTAGSWGTALIRKKMLVYNAQLKHPTPNHKCMPSIAQQTAHLTP